MIHGQGDTLIPIDHARRLVALCKDRVKLDERPRINHTTYDICRDIIEPIAVFLIENALNTEGDIIDPFYLHDHLYKTPDRLDDVRCR